MTQNIFLQGRRFYIYHGQKVFLQLFLPIQIEAKLTISAMFTGIQITACGIIGARQHKNNAGFKTGIRRRHSSNPVFPLFIFFAGKRI